MRPVGLLFLLIASLSSAQEVRTFTSAKGQPLRGKLVSQAGGNVTIQREDGRSFTVPLAAFSAGDQAYFKEQLASAPAAPSTPNAPVVTKGGPQDKVSAEELNAAIGLPLFSEASLWASPGADVAARMELKQESKTKTQSSYRNYTQEGFQLMGAHPYSVALYAENEKTTSLSLVYANKGDLFSAKGSAENHFDKDTPPEEAAKIVRTAMDKDLKAIETALAAKLGPATKARFGERGAGRMNMQRWDWRGHAILQADAVDEKEQPEYVGVQVVPTAFADAGGKAARTSDAVVREHAKGNIERRPNGDVIIADIPMVDQGPKGYCVPATMERAMRFMGVPADMYVLANAGNSGYGGGTSVEILLDNIGRLLRSKSRSFDSWGGELKVKDIARSVDKGVPIIWALYSGDDFNKRANERKETRAATTDWKAWKTNVTAEATTQPLTKDRESAHVVLIIGYNAETGEVAFSDSWGERYKERWMTAAELQQVSQERFYAIGF